MKNLIARFVREEEGQDIIEYSLLAAFISISGYLILQSIGTQREHDLHEGADGDRLGVDGRGELVSSRRRARPSGASLDCHSVASVRHATDVDASRRSRRAGGRSRSARFVRDDSGQDLIEYAFLAAFVGVAGCVALNAIGPAVAATYNSWIDPTTGTPSLWEPARSVDQFRLVADVTIMTCLDFRAAVVAGRRARGGGRSTCGRGASRTG